MYGAYFRKFKTIWEMKVHFATAVKGRKFTEVPIMVSEERKSGLWVDNVGFTVTIA